MQPGSPGSTKTLSHLHLFVLGRKFRARIAAAVDDVKMCIQDVTQPDVDSVGADVFTGERDSVRS